MYYKGFKKGQGGTGFLINKNLKAYIKQIDCAQGADRLISPIYLKIQNINIKIVQVFAPTSCSSEEEKELFYDRLQESFHRDPCRITIIMGDLNPKVGEKKEKIKK